MCFCLARVIVIGTRDYLKKMFKYVVSARFLVSVRILCSTLIRLRICVFTQLKWLKKQLKFTGLRSKKQLKSLIRNRRKSQEKIPCNRRKSSAYRVLSLLGSR